MGFFLKCDFTNFCTFFTDSRARKLPAKVPRMAPIELTMNNNGEARNTARFIKEDVFISFIA